MISPVRWFLPPTEPRGPSQPDDGESGWHEPRRRLGTVLIVEDDVDIRETLADILQYEGYPVLTAANGSEGLTLLRSGATPSLILLDLMMPIMDGWQLRLAQLRDPALAPIPVVVFSGTHDIHRQASFLGAADFLLKPIDVRVLLEIVRRHCG